MNIPFNVLVGCAIIGQVFLTMIVLFYAMLVNHEVEKLKKEISEKAK